MKVRFQHLYHVWYSTDDSQIEVIVAADQAAAPAPAKGLGDRIA